MMKKEYAQQLQDEIDRNGQLSEESRAGLENFRRHDEETQNMAAELVRRGIGRQQMGPSGLQLGSMDLFDKPLFEKKVACFRAPPPHRRI
jgi:hypothetical protein